MDSQLIVLKEYDVFAREKASEASTTALQEFGEKEQVADNIMRYLKKQFTIFANKVLPPDQ